MPLDIERVLLVRFGPEDLEMDENVLQIVPETQFINIAQHLYDFIGLAVPMKKLHPRFIEETGNEDEEDESEGLLIYTTGTAEEEEDDDDEDGPVDPRFEALRKIK
jgi:uncharacterized metal-binding protein YceD (DUF177 family)